MGCNYYIRPIGKDVENFNKSYLELHKYLSKFNLGFQIPEEIDLDIHICKISGGWKPILHITPQYQTLDDLDKFISDNKDKIIIVDEYNSEILWKDLRQKILDKYADNTNILHSDYCRANGELDFLPNNIDKYGIEWRKGDWC